MHYICLTCNPTFMNGVRARCNASYSYAVRIHQDMGTALMSSDGDLYLDSYSLLTSGNGAHSIDRNPEPDNNRGNRRVCHRVAGRGLVPHCHSLHMLQCTFGDLRRVHRHHYDHRRSCCSRPPGGHQTELCGLRGMMDSGLARWLNHDSHKTLARLR